LLLVWQWRPPLIVARLVLIELLVDVLAISLLMHASGGVRGGLGALLVVFVGAASLSLPGRQAFFASAIAALAVLAEQALRVLEHGAPSGDFVAAGVLGAIIFM